jgi:hypothetical protein
VNDTDDDDDDDEDTAADEADIEHQAQADAAKFDDSTIASILCVIKEAAAVSPLPNGRVQFALDALVIAACERGQRVFGGDLPCQTPTSDSP